jgi:7-keto-8-aminopelargonate synthetase-like enzyme
LENKKIIDMKNNNMTAREKAETKIRHTIHSCHNNEQLIVAERMIPVYKLRFGNDKAVNRLENEVLEQRVNIKLTRTEFQSMWDERMKIERMIRNFITLAITDDDFNKAFDLLQQHVVKYGDVSDELMQYYLKKERERL